jgi:two-component system OmpR family sensor kinase/two-component system sensor histidine kinase QseC
MNSIRTRLLVALALLVALVSLVAAAATYRRVLDETSTLFDYQLRQMALSLRSQITVAPRLEVPPEQGDTDFVVQIWDPFGARVYLSRPGLPMFDRAVLGYADLRLGGATWRAYGLQTADGVIQIAQPVRVREAYARAAALRVVLPLLLLLPFLMAAATWIVRRGFRPLQEVTAQVQRRDVRSLRPLAAAELPQEIEPLVSELNRLLARLQGAFEIQRAFVADAAHELRSPLTALRLQLQLLDRAPDETARAHARARLHAAVERAIHLVGQLLALARADPGEPLADFESFDLAPAVADACADVHAFAEARGTDLALESVPMAVRGDREGLRTLARNLVDNAVRYTPAGGSVRVSVTHLDAAALLTVDDSGPGIDTAERRRAFDRFYRRATTGEQGSGLGLAIVKAIAERHGAKVELGDAPGGGLRVRVLFPPSPP